MKNMYGKQVRGIERSTFLIDEDGVLIEAWRKVRVKEHVNAVLAHLKELN
jgi:peroxiredoxin Q/BCP